MDKMTSKPSSSQARFEDLIKKRIVHNIDAEGDVEDSLSRFRSLVERLRVLFCVKEEFCMGVQYLPKTDDILELIFHATCFYTDNKEHEIGVRIKYADLYVFEVGRLEIQKETKEWKFIWYSLENNNKNKNRNSKPLGFNGNYNSLDPYNTIMKLSIHQFRKAIVDNSTKNVSKWKIPLATIIETLCESIRFKAVLTEVQLEHGLEVGNDNHWPHLINEWSKISRMMWKYHHKGGKLNIKFSDGIHWDSPEDFKENMGVIKGSTES